MRMDTIQAFRTLAQARRRELGMSQDAAATKAQVSRKWLSDFESGKPTVELGKVLAILEALDVVLDARVMSTPAPGIPTEEGGVDLDTFLTDYQSDR